MKILIQIISITILFSSCTKDKLKGDREILIGKWTWIYSDHNYGWCNNMSFYDLKNPASVNQTFDIEFEKKGKVKLFENDNVKDENRVVFHNFQKDSENNFISKSFFYSIYLDNESENELYGHVNSDTLVILNSGFPFYGKKGCEFYWSYFIKQ